MSIVNNQRKSLPNGAKPIINISNIKVKKNDFPNDFKPKGKKIGKCLHLKYPKHERSVPVDFKRAFIFIYIGYLLFLKI